MGDGADDAFENMLRELEENNWEDFDDYYAAHFDGDRWPSALGLPLYAFEQDVPLYVLLMDMAVADIESARESRPDDPRPGDST